MKPLSEKQKRHLRGLGHKLKPVIMIGAAGYTPAVHNELVAALAHHELIKVRIQTGDREQRDEILARLCEESAALLVQRIGNVALLYRTADKPRIVLP